MPFALFEFKFYILVFIATERAKRACMNIIRIEEEYLEGSTNFRIHHFLQKNIAFNRNAVRLFLSECIAPRTI